MFAPHFGRWLSRDPEGSVDEINAYLYVDNRPILDVDPSGLAPAKPRGRPPRNPPPAKKYKCSFRICANAKGGIFSHLYLVAGVTGEENAFEVGFRAGPGQPLKCCQHLKLSQLVAFSTVYNDEAFQPDYRKPEDESCQTFEVETVLDCNSIPNCFKSVSEKLNACCIVYEASGIGSVLKVGGNSNSYIKWIVSACLPDLKLPVVLTPKGSKFKVPSAIPGWLTPMPSCLQPKEGGDPPKEAL